MEKLQIQGIFFDDLDQLFKSTLEDIFKSFDLPAEEFAKKINEKQEEVYEIFDQHVIDLYIKHNKFNVDDFLSSVAMNQKLILNQSRDSFFFFLFYINACTAFYEKCFATVRGKRLNEVIKLNLSLYGLILRRAQQIATMLLDGYTDGAMIIWRSLYEYSISLLVIAEENDNELAKKFYQHSFRNSKKAAISYADHYEELKFKAPPKQSNKILSEQELKLNNAYGKDFLDNEYGWADDIFPGKKKANLRELEEKVKMKRFRPYYLLCSQQIHSSFNGFKKFMVGNKIILPALLLQEEEKEVFIDPMQFTIGILHEVTNHILEKFSDKNEYFINLKFLTKIFQSMADSFSKK